MNDTIHNQAAPEIDTPSISSSALIVELNISAWSGRKKDKRASEEVTTSHQAKRGVANVNKALLPDCAELTAISKHVSNARNLHYSMTVPWSQSGLALVPVSVYFDYHHAMTGEQNTFYTLVEEFLDAYEWELSKAQVSLGSLFNRDEYPTRGQLERRFSFNINYLPVPEAGDFRVDLATEQKDMLREHFEGYYSQQLERSMKEVWERLYKVLSKMSERLDYAGKEDKKIFRDTLVDNVIDVVDMLSTFNLMGDSQMEQMRIRLEDAFRGVTADGLREDDAFRAETKRKVDAALSALPFNF